jgi:hypothetical protein
MVVAQLIPAPLYGYAAHFAAHSQLIRSSFKENLTAQNA